MEEIWKDIIGYEGLYQISNLGRVKSLRKKIRSGICKGYYKKELILTPTSYKGEYFKLRLFKDGIGRIFKIHRLIAIHFISNPNEYKYVNHVNGIKTDNRIVNLEWCTKSHDVLHAYRNKLTIPSSGEDHVGSKLNWNDVKEIRENKNNLNQRQLASVYGVDQKNIWLIIHNQAWKST